MTADLPPDGLIGPLRAAQARLGQVPPDARRSDGTAPIRSTEVMRLYATAMEAIEEGCCAREGVRVFSGLTGKMLFRAVMSCRDMRSVLQCCSDFNAMLIGGSSDNRLTIVDDHAAFELASRFAIRDEATLLSDLIGLHFHASLLSWLVGRSLDLVAVDLVHDRPVAGNHLLEVFRTEIRFAQPRNALIFHTALLDRPVIRTPAELDAVIDYFPHNLIVDAVEQYGLPTQVRLLLVQALDAGRDLPSAGVVATMLRMSPASLRRKLQAAGASYAALRALCLGEAAERLIHDPTLPLAVIADRLGFSDDRAFRRAFRKWTGTAPSTHARRRPVPHTL